MGMMLSKSETDMSIFRFHLFHILIVGLLALTACDDRDQSSMASAMPAQAPDDQKILEQARPKKPASPEAEVAPPAGYRKLSWDLLANVDFEVRYYPEIKDSLLYPNFAPSVQALAGEPIFISGYVIPLEPGVYFLSKNPFASCFFCGNAGPETVMELDLVDRDALYANDDFHTFKGTLRINDTDIDHLNYILEEAEVVE